MHAVASCLWRDIEVVITGLTRKRLTIVTLIYPQTLETLHFFGILSAEISEVGRQFSIKNPNRNLIRRDIEVVITGLTRNQFVRKHTRVRIPPSAPNENPPYWVGFLFAKILTEGFERSEQNNTVRCFVNGDRRFLRNIT